MQQRIFLSTCEFSGDMHGSVLLEELKKLLPGAYFYGVGGSRMAKAGMTLIYDPTKLSTLGFTEAIKNLRRFKRLIKEIIADWAQNKPDVVLWLDSGGFNLVLAKEAKKRGIPVICMFSPSAWAYGENRAVKLAKRVKLLLAVLPFEEEFYCRFGATVKYVGHPLLDRVYSSMSQVEFRTQFGIERGEKLLALLPGSRWQEVANLLPIMLEAVAKLNDPSLRLVLPVAASIDRNRLGAIISQYSLSVQVTTGNVYELLAAADAAMIASGTATLEAAILNTPMVIIYRVSRLSYFIYKRLVSSEYQKRPFIGLPNLIAGRRIVSEVTQNNLNSDNVARALAPILNDPETQSRIRLDLEKVREKIGPPGVMARAANLIVDELEKP